MICRMFMSVTMESVVFLGKNYLKMCHSIVNTTDLTLKEMFDISTRMVSQRDFWIGYKWLGKSFMEILVFD